MAKPRAKTPAKGGPRGGRLRAWLVGRTPEEQTWPKRLLRAAIVAIPAGFLLLIVLFGIAYALVDVPDPSEIAIANSTQVLDRHGRVIARLHAEADRVDIPISEMPAVVRQAVIAAEDHNFYKHGGVSIPSMLRAAFVNVTGLGVRQGGSTITQQYVKNAYVGNQRTIWRKVKEAVVAIKLERQFSKDEILADYLNTIYFGRGAYGVEAAARTYFSKGARALTLEEAALLAGMIRAPEYYDPVRDVAYDRAKARRDRVLDQMAGLGFIERDQADTAKAKKIVVRRGTTAASSALVGAHFVEDIRRKLVAQFGASRVYSGGLIVRTTLDFKLQRFAEDAVKEVLDRPTDPEAALVAIDPETGGVLAMVGGRQFSERQFNLASQGRRQAGSAFKPFVLGAAIDDGISIRSQFKAPASITLETGFEPWKVENYDKKNYGTLDLLQATEFSVNTVYAQLILKVGPKRAAAIAEQAGITSKLSAVPSLTLGTSPVSPVEMAGAYAGFATGGMHAAPYTITSVQDSDRKSIFRVKVEPARALDEAVANTVAYALQQVVKSGTGTRARLGARPVGGKTGTTENHIDAWFVGFTRQISTAVWMGYPEGKRTMERVRGIAVTGGSFPAQIWKAFMEKAVEGMPVEGFGKPTFAGEELNASPTPSSTPSPTPSTTVVPSLPPSKSPEPKPSPTKTNNSPSPSASPAATPP